MATPSEGLIPPDEFIPLVQHTGLIKPLSHYVLDMALRQCRSWMDRGRPLRIKINLAPRNLIDADLPVDVADLLWAAHGVTPALLGLKKITESTVVADPRRAGAVLARLAQIGVRLSVDDFGTGYSSLSYLTRFPTNEVKIDRSFVTNMTSSAGSEVIVRSTIDLGRNLGQEVVAEGVKQLRSWPVWRNSAATWGTRVLRLQAVAQRRARCLAVKSAGLATTSRRRAGADPPGKQLAPGAVPAVPPSVTNGGRPCSVCSPEAPCGARRTRPARLSSGRARRRQRGTYRRPADPRVPPGPLAAQRVATLWPACENGKMGWPR